MADGTSIEWTKGPDGGARGASWNPVRGCTPIAPECGRCYARTFAERWRGIPGHPFERGFDPRTVPDALDLPIRWKKPRIVFVNSVSDLFHDAFPDAYVDQVVSTMVRAHWHTFIVLTKRGERMRRYLEGCQRGADDVGGRFPWPHIWFGVSVGTRNRRSEIDHLRAAPAAVRMVSFEPLLEDLGKVDLSGIDFAAIGGESGPGARPCDVAWIRSLVKQCRAAGTAPFVKQLGANIRDRNDAGWDGCEPDEWPEHLVGENRIEHLEEGYQGAPVRVRTRDRKGGDPAEWPRDLRVREWPRVEGR